MAKDKKAKKAEKADKKTPAKRSKGAKVAKATKVTKAGSPLKALADHPLVADVVAAALVATATALKNPDRARALASEAADELGKLSKAGSERGNALWDMALQIGRRSLESFGGGEPEKTEPERRRRKRTQD